jgi:predicted small lipoprotein YifL
MTPIHKTIAALLFMLFLAGCGQSGPLYIPGEPASTEPPPEQAESIEENENDDEDSSRQ